MIRLRGFMLLARQKHLLALLDAFDGAVGNLDFQKLLFLYCQEPRAVALYEFVPYRLGAFSFTSYADRRRLAGKGLIEADDQTWRLTDLGRKAAREYGELDSEGRIFAEKHNALRGDALLAETYRRFPYYGIRSEIAGRVLQGDVMALRRIEEARPKRRGPGIATIGYEGRSIEGYLNELLGTGVTVVCDVRRNPLSRKYGFSKSTLTKGCEGVGIRYAHLPELGIASEDRRGLKTQMDYDALFEIYERKNLPQQKEALFQIRSWVENGERVALTCFERLPQQCHRHCVADALEQTFGRTFVPAHL
jgi:hypothetical protein